MAKPEPHPYATVPPTVAFWLRFLLEVGGQLVRRYSNHLGCGVLRQLGE
jgi:hypothetical protein